MKKLMLFVMCLAPHAYAQEDPGGFKKLFAEKIGEATVVGLLSLEGKVAGAPYLPSLVGHDKYDLDENGKRIVDANKQWGDIGVGWKIQQGAQPHAFIGLEPNVVYWSRRIWNFKWAKDHITMTKFPSVFLGPSFHFPLDFNRIKSLKFDQPEEWLWIMGRVTF